MARRLLLLAAALVTAAASAQPLPSSQEGPSVRNQRWSWEDYGAHHQNWATVQGPDGLIYVANTDGILEHDGEDWRLLSLPVRERVLVRSLAVGADGTVYVGGIGDLGALRQGPRGATVYRSLRDRLPPDEQEFQDVWTTHVTRDGIVFQTAERLFRWDGSRMESWSTPTRFRSAFLVGGTVYVWEEGLGIKRLRESRLEMIPGGAWFAEQKTDALLPHPEGLLAVVRDVGLVLVSRGTVRPVEGVASEYLRQFRPYTAIALPNPYGGRGPLYAVATFGGGVAVVGPDGRLVRVYGEDVGLYPEDQAVGLATDRQGGLWVPLLNGIVRIDLFSRLTAFSVETGLPGSVYAVAENRGTVYAGTSTGLYRLVRGRLGRPGPGPAQARFEPVTSVPASQTWALLATDHGLLVGTNDGVYSVEPGGVRLLAPVLGFTFLQPTARPDRVLVGSKDGVVILALRGGRWVGAGRLPGVQGEIRYLVEDGRRGVWLSEVGGNVFHVSDVTSETPTVRRAGPDALGAGGGPLLAVGDDIIMAPREGVFRLAYADGRIRAERAPALAGLDGVFALFPDRPEGGGLWLLRNGAFGPLSGRLSETPSDPFALQRVQVNTFTRTDDGVAWVGTADGLFRYDPRIGLPTTEYPAFVRRVTDAQREALWAGASGAVAEGPALELPFGDRSELRFEAAAAFFDAPRQTEYQFRLDGFNDQWGAWGPERVASYTSLREGDYTLRVRARDAYGRLSQEAAFTLRVLPPWHRTWWAYSLYALAGFGVVWGVSAWRLREHHARLDAQRARSARLQRLSKRLERLNARLRAADKLKDDLLANTSHELRTPLTSILGFSEMLLEEASADIRDLAEGVQRGGQRLLSTVNGLLDMYKLQSGTLTVSAAPADAVAQVRESVAQLQPLARGRNLDLDVIAGSDALPATLDGELLDRVVTNLVSNAIKFTDHGRVLVLVDGLGDGLRIAIRDTGIGIAPEDLARVFEPFEQASTGFGRTHEGTGLGLAIVRRIVDQVGGQIDIESESGVGTTITVTVPRHWGEAELDRGHRPAEPLLEGAHLLGVGLSRTEEQTVRQWVDTEGRVCTVNSLAKALREARKGSYDIVFLAAADRRGEAKRTHLLRAVPGYRETPLVRVGGEPLTFSELQACGFTHQVATPIGAEVASLVKDLLVNVEAGATV